MSLKRTDITVLGGGIIGLSIALRLLNTGREVVLIDPEEPGTGTSFGNAGTIAEYAVLPVGSPDIIRQLPSLLLNKNSPISIKRSAILSLCPWLIRFLYQSIPKNAARNAQAIASLLQGSRIRWEELSSQIGGESILKTDGNIYLYPNNELLGHGIRDMDKRRALGLNAEILNLDALKKLEPNLNLSQGGASYFPDGAYMSDPGKMVKLILDASINKGCQVINKAATRIERTGDGIKVDLENQSTMMTKQLVVAAGAYSKKFAHQVGDKIPLDVERGYHIEYDMAEPLLNRPCCYAAGGFYMSPMTGRLRVVGTVELGGLSPKISQHRIKYLEKGAEFFFPKLGKPKRTWLGFRPSIPDSRPVISQSSKGNDIVYAFGHGHIGLTLSPITAEIVYSILTKTKAPISISDFSAMRF